MQSLPPPPAAPSPRAARAVLPALAVLALLCAASPADALGPFAVERPHTPVDDVDSFGVTITFEVDPESGQVIATICLEHDPDWHFPLDAGQEDDGHVAVWAPAGPDPSDGSNKASTSCVETLVERGA